MKRLLLSALLAVLVHAYWLFSNVGEGGGTRPGMASRSVVISLATAQRPASDARTEPDRDVEPATQRREPVPVAAQPVIKEPKVESTEGDGPVDKEGVTTLGDSVEPQAEDASLPANAPSIEEAAPSLAQGMPKTKASTNPTWQVSREEVTRKTGRRPQAANSRSQPAKSSSRTATSEDVVRDIRQVKSATPQADRPKPGDDPPDFRGETQSDRAAGAKGGTSLMQTLEGVLQQARPLYKRNPSPPYPRVARRRGYEGTVVVRVLVGNDGLVNEVRLEQSSGYETLDRAALQTVEKWAFEPAVRGTEKVEMWVRIPLRFGLE